MGFYIKKSVSVGPLRFNLSKSGVGISAGFKGFRIGTGPRGNYVHMGRGGLYYRATLSSPSASHQSRSRPRPLRPDQTQELGLVPMTDIASAEAQSIVDSSSADLVAEMNAKRKMILIWPFVFGVGLIATLILLESSAPQWAAPAAAILTVALTLVASFKDRLRKTTVLLYELDTDVEKHYEALHNAFRALAHAGGRWHISARGDVSDWKRNAGAAYLLKRSSIAITTDNPPFVKSNITAPAVPVGRHTLYFFPDKLLIFEPNGVGAVSYENLRVCASSTRFIESGSVPRDAQIVDRTWKYVNKNGGPDRRFNDNREIPIALYEEIAFTSTTGLNERIQVSKTGLGGGLDATIKRLAAVSGGVAT